MIKSAYKNILETSSVGLSAGAEDASYPLYRLYDRGVGRTFRATAAGTVEIKIDQADTPSETDRLLIPSGHNLKGATLDVLCSDDDIAYESLARWAAGEGLINRTWSPVTHRYWKLRIEGPSAAPELAELFVTSTYEWERNPERPTGPLEDSFNVQREQTASGSDRFLVHGEPRRQRRYRVPRCGEAQKDNLLALYSEYGGSAPFWVEDHEGRWIYGRLNSPLGLKEIAHRTYSFDFDFMEVIG